MATQSQTPQLRLSMRRMIGQSFDTMTPVERSRTLAMYASIVLMHVVGFFLFIAYVLPNHYKFFGVGLSLTAYTLGLRHAFDADHISAIDNTTRKVMNERIGTGKPRPLSFGYFFSLGHSTIVFVIGLGIIVAEKTVLPAVTHSNSSLESFGGTFGTIVSAAFLFLIGMLNLVILAGIVKVFRGMRNGAYDDAALEEQLNNRGLMNRFLGPLARRIDAPWKMYPIGFLFGLGFDTATEVALLVLAGTAVVGGLPFYAVLSLPILFAAGMSLFDTADGCFMNFAYDWAFSRPIRKVYYNLTITGLSVFVAVFIGAVEVLGLLAQQGNLSGSGWAWVANFNINTAGFVIVGVFVLTWIVALSIWRFAKIEQKWDAANAAAAAAAPE